MSTANPRTVRVYAYYDSGPYLAGISETESDQASAPTGMGDSRILEIPRDLWERYSTSESAYLAAQDQILEIERSASGEDPE